MFAFAVESASQWAGRDLPLLRAETDACGRLAVPLSHRIACFRDDVVFFVYLYQRYKYPVDRKRANEFGRAYEDPPPTPAALEGTPAACPGQELREPNKENKKNA